MNLDQWAIAWGVPHEALAHLRSIMGAVDTDPSEPKPYDMSEIAVQGRVRLEATRKGKRLWRNNVGAYETENGGFVRYGLCNDTKQMNETIKSHDLIGINPVVITPVMVGTTIGQFMSREIKRGGWVYRGTPRERAQLKFSELVTALGGDAKFATGEGTL